ncbi:OLC1v1001419C1 [Oldenlandia corymbosa var. corymbosa]|uniref:OLC1v1001419C1 n=1 Tax=Oldenlandia corymbosa var. corymbosa TaxID=529605 RepID=A0AAV1D5H5_OLDCO|nr:OLC1v1001419C1 [Oldenlandia corymbosa var. corymbosa]
MPLPIRIPDNLVLVLRKDRLYSHNLSKKNYFKVIKGKTALFEEKNYNFRPEASEEAKRYYLRGNVREKVNSRANARGKINSEPVIMCIYDGPLVYTESLASIDLI